MALLNDDGFFIRSFMAERCWDYLEPGDWCGARLVIILFIIVAVFILTLVMIANPIFVAIIMAL